MKKKSVFKTVVALSTAIGICLSSNIVSFASPSVSVDYSTTVTNTGENRTFIDDLMGITYQTHVNDVSDINTTFKINKAETSNINALSEIQYGYLEGDRFITTYTNSDIYKANQSNEGNIDNSYPIFHVEQVQKDQQNGITDRIYVLVIDGLNNNDWTDNFFAYCFRFTGATTPVQSEGWVQDATGWWWRNADNSYPVNTWKEIDGKQYYFGGDGYLLQDTVTPDGYTVNADGVYVEGADETNESTTTINLPTLSTNRDFTELETRAYKAIYGFWEELPGEERVRMGKEGLIESISISLEGLSEQEVIEVVDFILSTQPIPQ